MGVSSADPTTQIPGYVAGRWVIDPIHSLVSFTVRHLMVSKVRGRFGTFSGMIVTTDDLVSSSVTAEVDMASIDTGDSERDDDLRSRAYFDSANHPTMTYRSTGVRTHGAELIVDGELTLHGVTRSVPLFVEVGGIGANGKDGTVAGLSATAEIDRRDFGIDLATPLTGGGVVVGNMIKIELEIEAKLRDQPAS
jgi:polyisoprenoid-binding protein YceI